MARSWKNYRHRFTPWLAWNWSGRQIKNIDSNTDLNKEKSALSQLAKLLEHLDKEIPQLTVKEWQTLAKQPAEYLKMSSCGRMAMRELLQFELCLRESCLEGGGRGVFVSNGEVASGQIVGLYPGTVYLPFEPLFFQSIGNPFVFRCADGWSIDGHHRYLSKLIYRNVVGDLSMLVSAGRGEGSCAFRDVIGCSMSCDLSWLSANPVNPLSVGQIVNNQTREVGANVEYVEMNIPLDFPLSWRRFLPNVFYSGNLDTISSSDERLLRCVALLSTRDIQCNEELYSSYLTLVIDEE